jgi:hypothetical protein
MNYKLIGQHFDKSLLRSKGGRFGFGKKTGITIISNNNDVENPEIDTLYSEYFIFGAMK